MNYDAAIRFLYDRAPMFQRVGAVAYKPGLKNTFSLLEENNNPHQTLKCIHVAGTNGKGSVSHFLASIFIEAGFKTGLYTSPHLKSFKERIKINGNDVSSKYVSSFITKNKKAIEKINPSFFEITFVMAMAYFSDKNVDIAIIETGLGGRLDSTNVIIPVVSVITNISKDHTQFLGNTLVKIAKEKAGIIKLKIPVVIGESGPIAVKNIFTTISKKNIAPLYFANKNLNVSKFKSELKGKFQQKNIRTVLKTVEVLNKYSFLIDNRCIKKGIEKVVSNTRLLGRWQTLSKHPHIICDIGHNEAGIHEVLLNLKNEKFKQLHFILGVVNDKDVIAMLSQLPKKAIYYFTNANIPRAKPANELEMMAKKYNLIGLSYTSVKKAVNAAKRNYKKGDLIFVGGSAFVVAEVV